VTSARPRSHSRTPSIPASEPQAQAGKDKEDIAEMKSMVQELAKQLRSQSRSAAEAAEEDLPQAGRLRPRSSGPGARAQVLGSVSTVQATVSPLVQRRPAPTRQQPSSNKMSWRTLPWTSTSTK
jgi:hypothetical protein